MYLDLLEYTVYLASLCVKQVKSRRKCWISQKKFQNIVKNKFFAVFLPIFSCTWSPKKIFELYLLNFEVSCIVQLQSIEWFHRADPKISAILINYVLCILLRNPYKFEIFGFTTPKKQTISGLKATDLHNGIYFSLKYIP